VTILTQPAATPQAVEVARQLGDEGLTTEVVGLPDREEAKTIAVASSVYEGLAKQGFTRYDTIVGVGGGSVTDVAGFVAGTWMRGVEAAHVPTTLLGAIDASIGGKTGVNLAGKNLVGVFWHPSRVVIDIETLSTLPASLQREGLAEALKAGLVGDPGLVELLAEKGAGAPLQDVVERGVRVKAAIVDQDEREADRRAFLNLGHTLGHAIEYASTLSHGESVSLGLVAACHISEKLHGFEETPLVTGTLEEIGLPIGISGVDGVRVRELLGHDKKRDAGGMRMILLRAVGDPVIRHVEDSDLEVGLASIGL
jgi:3-dehydroquinate synthase